MGGIGAPELLIILVIVVVLFGASRIAGVGAALGNSVRDFRKAMKEDDTSAASKPATGERPATKDGPAGG